MIQLISAKFVWERGNRLRSDEASTKGWVGCWVQDNEVNEVAVPAFSALRTAAENALTALKAGQASQSVCS